MNENTKNKFAEILKAAQDKANIASTPKVAKSEYLTCDQLNKVSVSDFIKSPNFINDANSPELSDMTFADLLSNDKAATKETIAPIQDKPNLRLIDYSDKSFAIIGDTKPIKDTLRLLGGSFNSRLTCGMGWIFSKKRMHCVCKELNLAEI